MDGLRYRAAQGEERHPVHRRRAVAGAPRGRAPAVQGHCGGQEPRQARDRRHAAHGAGGDRRFEFIITDSANAASAYATGHKTAVNAMGVYADRTASPFDDPKVETIASLAKRRHGMAIGIVTNTEIEDATPAAMVAHTRRRAAYDEIVAQFFAARPDVLMGGGAANFLPQAAAGSKRKDDDRLRRQIPRRRLRGCDDTDRTRCGERQIRHAPIARPVRAGKHGRRAGPQISQGRRRQEISRSA